MPRNLGTLLAIVSFVLLLGHAVGSGIPVFVYWSWKLIGFLVSLLLSVAVFLVVGNYYESAVAAWASSAAAMLVLVVIVGALV